MTRTALSLSTLLICSSAHAANVVIPGSTPPPLALPTATPAKTAPAAVKPVVVPAIATNEVENLVKAAAQLEKSDGCEAAYVKYQEAGGKLLQMKDHARAAQLSGIVTNKM